MINSSNVGDKKKITLRENRTSFKGAWKHLILLEKKEDYFFITAKHMTAKSKFYILNLLFGRDKNKPIALRKVFLPKKNRHQGFTETIRTYKVGL